MAATARQIAWRVFCPHCLTPIEKHVHDGLADRVASIPCARCRKTYSVTTGIAGSGMPLCDSTPTAIRQPELMADNDPFELP